MEQDESSLSGNIFFIDDSDGCDEEFHPNQTDVEIGTAIPLQRLSLNDPSSGKVEQNLLNRQLLCIAGFFFIFMAAAIARLSIEIGEPTGAPSSQPSSAPSTIPSFAPSLQPSCAPSTIPSLHPTVFPSSVPSLSKLVS